MKVTRTLIVICTWIALCASIALDAHAQRARHWVVSENQLNIDEGGRANTIALNPINPDRRFVASESGGLFSTENAGVTWTHIDVEPRAIVFTESIAYAPWRSTYMFASTRADSKSTNGGGLWASYDSGQDWQQVALPSHERLSAYEIAMQPSTHRIFVGTSDGAFQSSDNGLSWSRLELGLGSDKRIFSIMATETHVYFGGPAAVRVENTNNGLIAAPDFGGIGDMHAFGGSSGAGSTAFVVKASGALFVTVNGGYDWQQISSAPTEPACKGIPFIKAVLKWTDEHNVGYYDLHYSNGCWLHTATAAIGGAPNPIVVSAWHAADLDHRDPRDLAFIEKKPVMLASNGGLHKTADDGVTWRLSGAGAAGYNALQIHQVKGQRIRHDDVSSTFDLYVGTQDNNFWAIDGDQPHALSSYPWGGHHIETDLVVQPGFDPKITFALCAFGCVSRRSNRLLGGVGFWPDAPNHRGTPVAIHDCHFAQNFRGKRIFGAAVTEQCGEDWQTFAQYRDEPRDVPKLAQAGNETGTTILYQAYKTNTRGPGWSYSGGHLLREEGLYGSGNEGTVSYPTMQGFGVLGVELTMLPVFAIDPADPDHIIAADVEGSGSIKQIRLGDDDPHWDIITSLTNEAVKEDNRLQLTSALDRNLGPVFSLVTAISFSPQDPSLVLAGTSEGGIYASNDGGGTWAPIPETDRVTNVTSFAWENANRVYVSTFGRGLWRLDNTTVQEPASFNDLCGGTCEIVASDGTGRPPFDSSAMVFDGSVLGVRTQDKQLREVFVTPGSSVVFTGDEKDPHFDVVITERDGHDKCDCESLPKGPSRWIAKGVVMANGGFAGAVFGDSTATLVPPAPKSSYRGSTQSPTSGKPYVTVSAADVDGVATLAPAQPFALSGTDFVAGVSYDVLIDDQLVKTSATADGGGSFEATVVAPAQPGYHRVDVRDPRTETILDGSAILVRSDR